VSAKAIKILFAGSKFKSIRKQMLALDRHPKQRLMHMQEIKRPRTVTLADGTKVPYEGP